MKTIVSLLALLGLVSLSLADEHATEGLDYGDHTSVTLQVKAWEALGEGKYEDAVKYTEKCAELYEDEARKMQASLSSKPSGDGSALYIPGRSLRTRQPDDY